MTSTMDQKFNKIPETFTILPSILASPNFLARQIPPSNDSATKGNTFIKKHKYSTGNILEKKSLTRTTEAHNSNVKHHLKAVPFCQNVLCNNENEKIYIYIIITLFMMCTSLNNLFTSHAMFHIYSFEQQSNIPETNCYVTIYLITVFVIKLSKQRQNCIF